MNLVTLAALVIGISVALSAVMAIAWRVQLSTGATGWIDVFWTMGVGGTAVIGSLLPLAGDRWPHVRQFPVAGLAALWALRLGWRILARARTIGDDPRYRHLIRQWGREAPSRMFWQLQKQAGVSVIFSASIVLAAQNSLPRLRIQDVIGAAIVLLAVAGESVADHQLRRFRADPAHRLSVCDIGLWRWSRHPNYFFEWLGWIGYPLIAIDFSARNSYGWFALLAPACMYWTLVFVSGIPPLEEHMLRSRGDLYRSYQKRTNSFFPWPQARERAPI